MSRGNKLLLMFLLITACADPVGSNVQHGGISSREDDDDDRLRVAVTDCPVGLVSGLTLDDEFGPGTTSLTRCLDNRSGIRFLFQVNKTCDNSDCTRPFAIGNINNAIKDYEITHGLQLHINYDITMVVYHAGYRLVVNNNATDPFAEQNPFQTEIEELLAKGVHIYFCQNTGRSRKMKTAQLIPGIKWVTSGVTAISDFQANGYTHINP